VSTAALALRQVRYENKSFWRNPAAAFFTFAFPIMFLIIFNLLFGNANLRLPGGHVIKQSTFYVAAIIAFSIITASYTNLAMNVVFARDQGILKRKRGTPMPPLAYISGKILHSGLIALLLVVIIIVFGKVFYGVSLAGNRIPAFLVSLAIGALSFSAMGLAITTVVPNADAAPAVINATILPLLFISDIFIPLTNAPEWLGTVGNIFPVRHFAEAMHQVFNPFAPGTGFQGKDLLVIGIWGLVSLLLAAKFFRWEPRR
jgi:ABC-2 type transport system permease protein